MMTIPEQSKQQPGAADQDEWPFDEPWPFPDDLDDYERELEAAYVPKACRPSGPEWEATLAWHQAMAKATLESEHPGRIPEGMELPVGWVEYVRNRATAGAGGESA